MQLNFKLLALAALLGGCLGNGQGYPGTKADMAAPALGNFDVSCVYAGLDDVDGAKSAKVIVVEAMDDYSAKLSRGGGSLNVAASFDQVTRSVSDTERIYTTTDFELHVNLNGSDTLGLTGSLDTVIEGEAVASDDLECTIK